MDDLILVIGTVCKTNPLVVMIPDKLVQEKKLHAGEIVKNAAREFDGGGGGQPFFATAGGKDPEKLDKAMEKALYYWTEEAMILPSLILVLHSQSGTLRPLYSRVLCFSESDAVA